MKRYGYKPEFEPKPEGPIIQRSGTPRKCIDCRGAAEEGILCHVCRAKLWERLGYEPPNVKP